ncbi:protein indeterminate-domain 11 [Neltuma alba]|uniref:protein indeterminate-domain 11 n=1 Tax=Neltuma alba TaxID=207710 RepID=UPI0010A5218D|nr:protein indeterminate-domain 11-like [Prosopis alba]
MMKALLVDENMSNLTSASSEISASSGTRNDTPVSLYPQQYSSTSTNQEPQPKKKRNLPGNPDPEAEVIALSPKSLLATNRFICEICNKGFQRDQNLQLHRRGHNLPWKLKQRNNKEVIKKKVYVCPEVTCVHHDPSRALGDLTGIKKHFCRKHGEKKWKCEKCSKRYAVQSDWKAHSKICGTKEYKCDCGTIFSRRDSFITHRAFCDALAQESARTITAVNPLLHSHPLQAPPPPPTILAKKEQDFPPWLGEAANGDTFRPLVSPSHLDHSFNLIHHHHQNPNPAPSLPHFQSPAPPYMSATALLQKASQIGHMPQSDRQCTTMPNSSSSSAVSGLGMPSRDQMGLPHALASYGNKAAGFPSEYLEDGVTAVNCNKASPPATSLFHDMMANTASSATAFERSSFEDALRGMLNPARDTASDEMTRDFLGLKAFSQKDFFNISGLDHLGSSSYGKQSRNQTPWQG